jgi:hypothetical protein
MYGGADDCGCDKLGGADELVAKGGSVLKAAGSVFTVWFMMPIIIVCVILVLISIFFIIGDNYKTGFTLMGIGIAVPAGIFFLASKV